MDISGTPWILTPAYNVATKTLYFTLCWKINDHEAGRSADDNYVIVRPCQAKSNDGTIFSFSAPTAIAITPDPEDESDKITPSYHPSRHWIGRVFVNEAGNKAYFTCMNDVDVPGNTSTDPYSPPYASSTATRVWTYILSADITEGTSSNTFSNPAQLSSSVNKAGINYVADISPDGNYLYVAHMDIPSSMLESGFFYKPDGLCLDLCNMAPYEISEWTGKIARVPTQGL